MLDKLKKGIVKFGGGVRGVLSPIYSRVVTPIVTGSQSAIEAFMSRVRSKPQLNSPSASETTQEAGIFRKGYDVVKNALGKINFGRKADTITTEAQLPADSSQDKPGELDSPAQSNEVNSSKEVQLGEPKNYKGAYPDEITTEAQLPAASSQIDKPDEPNSSKEAQLDVLKSYKGAYPDEKGFYDPLDYDDDDDDEIDAQEEAESNVNHNTSTNDAVQNTIEEPAFNLDEAVEQEIALESILFDQEDDDKSKERAKDLKAITGILSTSNVAALRLLTNLKSSADYTFTPEEKAEIDLALVELLKQNSLSLLRGISYTSSYIAQEIDRIIAETVPSHLRNVLSIPSAPSWLIPWLPVDTTGIFLLSAGSQIRSAIDITGLWSIYTAAKFPFVAAHFLSEASITILENPDNPTQAIIMRAADIAEGYIARTATLVTDHAELLNVRLNG